MNIRRVVNSDSKRIFDWANDPVTRSASFNTKPILWEEHERWFNAKLLDDSCYFYIGEVCETACGTIRFDVETDNEVKNAVISYNIAPDQRKKGYGALIIKEGIKKAAFDIGECVFVAEVKPENEASIRCFESSGFSKTYSDREKIIFTKKC